MTLKNRRVSFLRGWLRVKNNLPTTSHTMSRGKVQCLENRIGQTEIVRQTTRLAFTQSQRLRHSKPRAHLVYQGTHSRNLLRHPHWTRLLPYFPKVLLQLAPLQVSVRLRGSRRSRFKWSPPWKNIQVFLLLNKRMPSSRLLTKRIRMMQTARQKTRNSGKRQRR